MPHNHLPLFTLSWSIFINLHLYIKYITLEVEKGKWCNLYSCCERLIQQSSWSLNTPANGVRTPKSKTKCRHIIFWLYFQQTHQQSIQATHQMSKGHRLPFLHFYLLYIIFDLKYPNSFQKKCPHKYNNRTLMKLSVTYFFLTEPLFLSDFCFFSLLFAFDTFS